MNLVSPLLMVALGLVSIVFRRQLVEFRQRAFGLSTSDQRRRWYETIQIVIGIGLIIFGTVMLLFYR